MSFCLAIECSTEQGSLALGEINSKQTFKCLAFRKWHQNSSKKNSFNRHSHKLVLEIKTLFKEAGKKLTNLDFLTVGVGPGRWTGVRMAMSVTRTLAFGLKIPICPINSLRVSAEPFLSQSLSVIISINAFKNQVYLSDFHSSEEENGNCRLLNFESYCHYMNKLIPKIKNKKMICISDLNDFYPHPQNLKEVFSFKKNQPSALSLGQIASKQNKPFVKWQELKAFYLRSPVE